MFDWNRKNAPEAEAPSIPMLSLEEMKQVSGAGFILAEDSAPMPGVAMLAREQARPMGFILSE
jgi:hypothetical protein